MKQSLKDFRHQVAQWLRENLTGRYEKIKGTGMIGDDATFFHERLAWERVMSKAGWTCLGWPQEYGGKALSFQEQVVFYQEYALAGGPGRIGHIGETLAGHFLLKYGTKAQKERYLPPIRKVSELWSQGYSEPQAGSDLANVRTRAIYEQTSQGNFWIINGQKTWTSLAHEADFCFVLVRTDLTSKRHHGLSKIIVPLKDTPGVTMRPIKQINAGEEFNDVFFDDVRVPEDNLIGNVGQGWAIAMDTLTAERGLSTLGQQMGFKREMGMLLKHAQENGAIANPHIRQQLAKHFVELDVIGYNIMRALGDGKPTLENKKVRSILKLSWSRWHRSLGELAMEIMGPDANALKESPYSVTALQHLFLFSRSDTIYAGTSQIQRNMISKHILKMSTKR